MAHGLITAALVREVRRLERQATFEHVESKVKFTRCIRQGSVVAQTLRLKLAKHIYRMWEKAGRKNGDPYCQVY